MARKTQPLRQVFIHAMGAFSKALGKALATLGRRREPETEPVQAKAPAIEKTLAHHVPAKDRSKPRKQRPKAASPKPEPKPEAKPSAPPCPHCKKPMVIKVARTGKNAGEFWGCATYPKCRGIRPIFRKQ
ncbi:topoisomerase DNA-binding C4 zinc finger domain-containing protein [Pseudomonas floridensis]